MRVAYLRVRRFSHTQPYILLTERSSILPASTLIGYTMRLVLKVSPRHVTSHNSIHRVIARARAAINCPGWLSKVLHSFLAHPPRVPWPFFSSVASFLPFMHTRGYDPGNLESRQDQKASFPRASVITVWESPHWTSIAPLLCPQVHNAPSGIRSPD